MRILSASNKFARLASLKGDQDTETEVVGQASILNSGLSTTPLKGIKLFAEASKACYSSDGHSCRVITPRVEGASDLAFTGDAGPPCATVSQ